jgi:hypothetical protein
MEPSFLLFGSSAYYDPGSWIWFISAVPSLTWKSSKFVDRISSVMFRDNTGPLIYLANTIDHSRDRFA